jgi:adenosine/AMP kinase
MFEPALTLGSWVKAEGIIIPGLLNPLMGGKPVPCTMGSRPCMELKIVKIDNPGGHNLILGHSHFIKTVEDLYEAIVQTAPAMKFGIAFCEASGPALVRHAGNQPDLILQAQTNALAISAGHSFIIFLDGGFPINILNTLKSVPEVCRIFCATANPVEVILAETGQGRGILGVIDGEKPKGVETESDVKARIEFLRKIGYKLG